MSTPQQQGDFLIEQYGINGASAQLVADRLYPHNAEYQEFLRECTDYVNSQLALKVANTTPLPYILIARGKGVVTFFETVLPEESILSILQSVVEAANLLGVEFIPFEQVLRNFPGVTEVLAIWAKGDMLASVSCPNRRTLSRSTGYINW